MLDKANLAHEVNYPPTEANRINKVRSNYIVHVRVALCSGSTKMMLTEYAKR